MKALLIVPPSGGSLEIGNFPRLLPNHPPGTARSSPFGGIPRNWKFPRAGLRKRPGSRCSPFGGIPRNWKYLRRDVNEIGDRASSPFGGIPRNWKFSSLGLGSAMWTLRVPPSGGSLEIGNSAPSTAERCIGIIVPPSGGSLEIGNTTITTSPRQANNKSSPFGGIPRNWKSYKGIHLFNKKRYVPPSGGSLEIGNTQSKNWK